MTKQARLRNFVIGLGVISTFCLFCSAGETQVERQNSLQGAAEKQVAPRFEVDPFWPKPLPNHWVLGSVIGVAVDSDDHVWVVHRGATTLDKWEKRLELKQGECCAAAPPVLEFDQAGNLLRHWGGPGKDYDWPFAMHGIYIDPKNNVWLAAGGGGDSHLLKFTKDGRFLKQFGKADARHNPGIADAYTGNSSDPTSFGRPAKVYVDPIANEAYVADGYLNRRIAVIDADTGQMKRFWGAYGNKPDDAALPPYNPSAPPSKQFGNPVHCADMSVDRLVYVCDRANDRLQVFTPEGKFIKEAFFSKNTLSSGSVWDIAFSRDPGQKYIFIADGVSDKVRIVDRQTLKEITNFGDGGRQPGQFHGIHSIAIDSKGNLYTTETYDSNRVQRFLNKGTRPANKLDQGVVWPSLH